MNRRNRRATAKGDSPALKRRKAGDNLVRSGNMKKAVTCFEKSIALDSDDATSHSNLAYVLAQLGDIAGAVNSYENARQISPRNTAIQTNLGLLHVSHGRAEEALTCFERAIAVKPDHTEALIQIVQILKHLNRRDDAAMYLTRAFQTGLNAAQASNASDEIVMMKLGLVLSEFGRTKDALVCFIKASEISPKEAVTHYHSGVAHAKLGKYEDAAECFQRAVAINPDKIDYHKRLGFVLMELGRFDDAALNLATVVQSRPDDYATRHFLSAIKPDASDDENLKIYVENLFDDYAETFDDHLVNGLQYRAPELLRLAIGQEEDTDKAGWNILDLGCGTGLCGVLFRDLAAHHVGVDLSARMLDQARKRGIYDELRQDDVKLALNDASNVYDLIIAADVMIYVGDLAPLFAACARALRSGGRFAFTTEVTDDDDFSLDMTGRYRHAPE